VGNNAGSRLHRSDGRSRRRGHHVGGRGGTNRHRRSRHRGAVRGRPRGPSGDARATPLATSRR
jgi:hypothetical protein